MVETLATNSMSDSTEPPIVYPFTTIPAPTHRPIAGGLLSAAAAGPYLLFGILFYGQWWRGLKSPSSLLPDERTSLSVYLALLWMLGMLIALPWMWKLFNLGRRMRQADAVDLLNQDHRAPVIFLRSFGDDELPDPTLIGMARTVEERLGKALALLGPVIAVGHPGERLVHLGAARLYVPMDEWQNAIRYFLDRAAAVVIIVGQSQGVLWEVDQALKTVDPCRLLIGFPYSLSMARRPWWLPYARFVRNFHYSLSVLSVMTGEREGRYQTFRSRVMADMSLELPASPGDSVFIDFLSSRVPRLLPSRPHVLMVNSYRDELDVQPDYKRTVRPFVEKLLGRALTPSRLESIYTDRRSLVRAGWWLAGADLMLLVVAIILRVTAFSVSPLWIFLSVPILVSPWAYLRVVLTGLDRSSSAPATPTTTCVTDGGQHRSDSVFSFQGRVSRGRFFNVLFLVSLLYVLVLAASSLVVANLWVLASGEAVLFLISTWICLAMLAKRWHDLDRSGWMTLTLILPFINLFVLLYLTFAPGATKNNRYGESPLDRSR